jgi:hypothetical protein
MRDNWLSNRVFKSYDDIVEHCCYAWKNAPMGARVLISETWYNLYATELSYPQSFYTAGGRDPALYDYSDTTDWGKYNPDVWQTDTPSISAAYAFQASP